MPPSLRVSVGVPPATVTASLRLSVSVTRLAGIEVARPADAVRIVTDDTVGGVVSICGPPWVRPVSDRLAALPAPSVTVAPLRLTAVPSGRGCSGQPRPCS